LLLRHGGALLHHHHHLLLHGAARHARTQLLGRRLERLRRHGRTLLRDLLLERLRRHAGTLLLDLLLERLSRHASLHPGKAAPWFFADSACHGRPIRFEIAFFDNNFGIGIPHHTKDGSHPSR
jgi:hypothetical protein